MPQVDRASPCAGGVGGSHTHKNIACGTLAAEDHPPSDPLDLPPESFFISKDAEFDWIDRNAFIERKDSGKGGVFHSTPHCSASQRYSLSVKSKPSIIGLPKSQKAAYAEAKHRRPPTIHLFPKRLQSSTSKSGRKSQAPLTEPSSPKVSCIGRVRSRRDRSRLKKNRQKQSEPAIKRSRSIKIHKTGFWSNFRSIFGPREHRQPKDDEPAASAAGTLKKSRSIRKRNFAKAESSSPSSASTPPADPPTLVAVKQFTSGRRSEAWAADLEVEVAKEVS